MSEDIVSTPIDPQDPRLTAYALGELQGDERAAFEALLAGDPAAQCEVEELRALGSRLETELTVDGDAQLDLAARNELIRRAQPSGARGFPRWAFRALAAACLLVALIVSAVVVSSPVEEQSRSRLTAAGRAPDPLRQKPGDLVNLDDVTNGLEDGSSAGLDNAGGALPAAEALNPGSAPADQPWETPDDPSRTTAAVQPTSTGGVAVAGGGSGTGGGGSAQSLQDRLAAERETFRLRWYSERFPGELASRKKLPPNMRKPNDPNAPTTGAIGVGGGYGAPVPVQPGMDPAAAARALRYFERAKLAGLRRDGKHGGFGSEHYVHPGIDPFHRVTKRQGHTSTFGVDVDTASYANIRRMLRGGQLPPPAAVRVEELVNYFDYGYGGPEAVSTSDGRGEPFRTHVQIATCPWEPKHRIARIALKGREVDAEKRPAANLVFLVDVSGSMQGEDKLPLVKAGLERLTESIRNDDRIAIVTYAAEASLRLGSTPGSEREAILAAIRALKAGGSTNGAGGIQMAYAEAQKGFQKGGVNRVILCTDGDFNVGISDTNGLVRLISQKAKSGVYLSVLGYGTGNFQDGKMEALSNKGNGNYAYIDGQKESERVLVEEMQGTLVTIAKDVKFQLWFNPQTVAGWRLLGYENRRLAARDFNDDSKDAGDIGAGHEVTALYEIIPTGAGVPGTVDPNPFVAGGVKAAPKDDAPQPEAKALFIWRLRWKAPDGDTSQLIERNVFDKGLTFEKSDRDFQWATAVGAFGMLLRHSPHRGQASWELVLELAAPAKGEDPHGRRAEFLELVKRAQALMTGGSDSAVGAQPSHTGRVLSADNQAGVVVISLGAEDGVKPGFQYIVSRGGTYVGTVRITDVQAKQSAGRVMKEISRGEIRSGDSVMNGR